MQIFFYPSSRISAKTVDIVHFETHSDDLKPFFSPLTYLCFLMHTARLCFQMEKSTEQILWFWKLDYLGEKILFY